MNPEALKTRLKRKEQKKFRGHKNYSPEKKLEVVQTWLVLGNCEQVGSLLKISPAVIRLWKTQAWWKELESQLREEENIQVSGKLKRIVEKSLGAVEERLEKGDWYFNPKTGSFERRPVLLRDATNVAKEFMERRQKLQEVETAKAAQPSIQEALKQIAAEFAKIARGTNGQSQETSTELQERIPELSCEPGAEEATGVEECGTSDDGAEVGSEDLYGRGSSEGTERGGDEYREQSSASGQVTESVVSER